MFEGMPRSELEPERFPRDKRRAWVSNEYGILVELDEQDRVSGAYFGYAHRPESFLAKLRRWAHL
jgi:hypothetical protein